MFNGLSMEQMMGKSSNIKNTRKPRNFKEADSKIAGSHSFVHLCRFCRQKQHRRWHHPNVEPQLHTLQVLVEVPAKGQGANAARQICALQTSTFKARWETIATYSHNSYGLSGPTLALESYSTTSGGCHLFPMSYAGGMSHERKHQPKELWLKQKPKVNTSNSGRITASKLWLNKLPKIKDLRLFGSSTPSNVSLKRYPKVSCSKHGGNSTPFKLWLKFSPKVKLRRLGKSTFVAQKLLDYLRSWKEKSVEVICGSAVPNSSRTTADRIKVEFLFTNHWRAVGECLEANVCPKIGPTSLSILSPRISRCNPNQRLLFPSWDASSKLWLKLDPKVKVWRLGKFTALTPSKRWLKP